MKRFKINPTLFVFVWGVISIASSMSAATLFDQKSLLYETETDRGVNWQSKGGVPLSSTQGTPAGSSGTAPADPVPTVGQFQGGMSYGAVTFQRQTTLAAGQNFEANARNLDWPHTEDANSNVDLVLRAQIGAPYMMRSIAFFFGAPIPVPLLTETGSTMTEAQAQQYWAAEPVTTNNHEDTGYYWSPHASTVYAIQPGRVDVTWRRAAPEAQTPANTDNYTLIGGNYFLKFSTNYTVSGATFKTPRKIYWTEKTFQSIGKPIQVPTARVGALNIVYQNEFPEKVSDEFVALGQSEITASTNRLQELRTLWYDRTDGQIHAYNKEGRVFMEILGDVKSGDVRNQLGYEIVDIIKQAAPADVTTELGDKLTPPPSLLSTAQTLYPEPLLSDVTKNFAFQHTEPGRGEISLYATRETKNLNDYQVYWMEESIAGLRWPAVLARYALVWPSDPARYSHYIRPAVDALTAKETGVQMPTDNVPVIEWQDRDANNNPRALLTEDFKFYTYLDSAFPAHRSLLRFTSGENIAFERVFSWLDDTLKQNSGSGFNGSVASNLDVWDSNSSTLVIPVEDTIHAPRIVDSNVYVGQRLAAPAQEAKTYSQDELYLAGSIRQPAGTGFSVSAYINPFEVGFEEAARGSIIPINANNNSGSMEVWWYRKNNQDATKGFKPIYWPSVIGRYTVTWPTTAPFSNEIILASNDGSGPLTSLQAKGSLYFQNDSTKPGYNPNEEHALMQGGQVYALRDDLNITSGANYSSHPYALLEYTDSDGRPSMSVFQILREKGDIKFDYAIDAGTVLQPPMPLPLMAKPFGPRAIGAPAVNLNTAIASWSVDGTTVSTVDGVSQVVLTTAPRHFFKPYELLVLQNIPNGVPVAPSWFYVTTLNADTHSATGFVADSSPLSLSKWANDGDQSADQTKYRFKVDSAPTLAASDKVFIARADVGQSWIAVVDAVGTSSGEHYVDVTFPISNRALVQEADMLLKPLTNVVDNQYAGAAWQLAYQALSPTITDATLRSFYAGFTLQDRKGDVWIYRGPNTQTDNPALVMQFYYKTLPGFYYPGLDQPPVGTITPYLRPRNSDGSYVGNPVFGDIGRDSVGDGDPLGIHYRPVWPEGTPVLQMAETLTLPKRGLPSVRGQRSLEVIYQQSQVQPGKTVSDRSVVLHDPTRQKIFELGEPDSTTRLGKIPDSVKTSDYRGRTYFPNLPPHLSERFYLDPTRGANGALVFVGEFFDEPVGDDYLLLNVLSSTDLEYLKGLCLAADGNKGLWDAAITTGLQTVMELFVENPAQPGSFIPSAPETINPGQLAEVKNDDVAVDSYALTSVGPGTGYVTLLAGNGFNSDVTPVEEPVSVQIIRVVDKLYRGELKIVQSSNPLAERLVMQQVVDLAAQVDDYEFEWMISAPVDGQPPVVYQNTRQLLMGDGTWQHIHFPLSSDRVEHVSEATVPADRRAGDVNSNVTAVSGISFQSVSMVDSKWHFITSGNSVLPTTGNQVVVRYEDGSEVHGTVVPTPSGQPAGTLVVEMDAGQDLPEGELSVIRLYESVHSDHSESMVFREFEISNTDNFSQYYLSLDLHGGLGARVHVDGGLAVTVNMPEDNTSTVSAPSGFTSLPLVYRLGPEVFSGGFKGSTTTRHRISVELFSSAQPDVLQTFNMRLEAYQIADQVNAAGSPWLRLDEAQYADKVRAIIGENADVRALSDNYLISRYRATSLTHASYRPDINGEKQGWSQWTDPQLAEGWIKRVLAGINPFNQRVTDLFNNSVNSDASILTQAGPRWEGDVALNLDSINDYGLIEIYETILRRGKSLSIGSGINYGPANDALLLAAGYLNDLYMMLGNEAWADAANPTIGIGTKDRTYGDIATALFAFKGQVGSLLEEELALLRGRDDFLVPGVETRPVYNRLFWNYTRGIDSGEVIYALNYNIQEQNDSGFDGVINTDDARHMFPQGHGDAYGHYLTALKGYYALLIDDDFDWVPRIEAVTVLGKPVSVDYQDERKFAAAAAAMTQAGRQIFDLTWRRDFVPGDDSGWDHLSQERTNTTRQQPVPRKWGVDHWGSRVGQGAYFNWAIGNAILPAVDNDPAHEGIQKVDRTTVPELKELATMADDLQTAVDNAEGHLTPLGLAPGSLAFDISPTKATGPDNETHFEQVYDRAKHALSNALVAFDDAKDVTRLMRSEQDSLADLQTQIDQQEFAYNESLIEIYGTPYSDDMGAGKTYSQDYRGPDLIHYSYADLPETVFPELWSYTESDSLTLEINDVPTSFQNVVFDRPNQFQQNMTNVVFNLGPHGFFGKPTKWRGRREYPGELQQAASEIIASHTRLRQAINDAVGARNDWVVSLNYLNAKLQTKQEIRDFEYDLLVAEEVLEKSKVASELVGAINKAVFGALKGGQETVIKGLPRNLIAGLAAGGDLSSPARAALGVGILVNETVYQNIEIARKVVIDVLEQATSTATRWTKYYEIEHRELILEMREDFLALANQLGESQAHLWTINQGLRELDDAWRRYRALEGDGDAIQAEREIFRQRSAALVQGFRTRDAAFRIFRNEKLERYKTLFDLAARYSFLAANAYDYETGLLHTTRGKEFVNRIVNSRALGVMANGEPQFAGSNTGDPGLSSVLAEMKADFDVLKGRLGFNNPDGYGTTVSLRMEKERIVPAADGDALWKDVLELGRKPNLLDDADVRRYCMQLDRGNGLPVPGIVLEFNTTIDDAKNLFGKNLQGGDHYFDTSSFASKIFSVGVAFEGYVGMDNPVSNTSVINATGGFSPPDPSGTFLGSRALAATPGVYLIPVGVDSMRSPPLGDSSQVRSWNVKDVAIPLPFNIGGSDFSTKALWQSSESLTEPLFAIRKHQAFRPVSTTAAFNSNIYGGFGNLQLSQFTNNRLIGRSVWNSKWKLVIPGHKLLGDPMEGLDRFIETVKDVKIHFVTYSYAGN